MKELDRLGWEAGIAFRAYGTRVGVRVNQADVLERLEPLFPPGSKPARSRVVDRLYSLRVGSNRPSSSSRICWYNLLYAKTQRISRTTDLDDLLQVLASDMRLFVAETSETRVFIHAGVVGWRGRAIVLPGKTFSGKSTLVAGLVKAGAIPSFLGSLGYLLEFAFPRRKVMREVFPGGATRWFYLRRLHQVMVWGWNHLLQALRWNRERAVARATSSADA